MLPLQGMHAGYKECCGVRKQELCLCPRSIGAFGAVLAHLEHFRICQMARHTLFQYSVLHCPYCCCRLYEDCSHQRLDATVQGNEWIITLHGVQFALFFIFPYQLGQLK